MERAGFIGFWSGIAERESRYKLVKVWPWERDPAWTSVPLWRPATSPGLFSDNLPLINVKVIRGDGARMKFWILQVLTPLLFCLLSKAAALLTVCSYFPISTLSFYSLLRSTSFVPSPFFLAISGDFYFIDFAMYMCVIVTTLTYDTKRWKWDDDRVISDLNYFRN